MRIDPARSRKVVGYGLVALAAPLLLLTGGVAPFPADVSLWLAIACAFLMLAAAGNFAGRHRSAAALAMPGVVIGLAAVAAYLLAFNGLLAAPAGWGLYLLARIDLHIGAGLALLAGSLAIFGAAAWREREFSAEILAVACLLLLVIVPLVMLGQHYDIAALDAGILVRPMRVADAALLYVVALLLLLHLLLFRRRRFDLRHRFLPVLAFALLLTASFHMWLVLVDQDQRNLRRQSELTVDRLQASLSDHLAERMEAINRMALRLTAAGEVSRDEWEQDAEAYLRDFPSVSALGIVSEDQVLRWAVGRERLNYEEGERYAIDSMRQEMLALTRSTGTRAFSDPVPLGNGGYGQLVAIPLYANGTFRGWLVSGLIYDELFAQRVVHVAPDYEVVITSDSSRIYSRVVDEHPHPLAWTSTRDVKIANLAWRISIHPTRAFFGQHLMWLPGFLLMLGVVASLLFGFSLYQLEAQRRHTAHLRDSEERFRLVAEQTGEVVYDWDVETGRIRWAGAIREVLRMSPETMANIGIDEWLKLVHAEDRGAIAEQLVQTRENLERFVSEYRLQRGDGTYVRIEEHGVFIAGPAGKAVRMLGVLVDVTERYQFNEQLRRLAHFDQQTGMRNRTWFMEDAVQATEHAAETQGTVWFLFMDVDRFKAINETLGHVIGDRLLEGVARRLENAAGRHGVLARLGGDEFGLCIPGEDFDRRDMSALCNALMDEFSLPFSVGEQSLFVTISAGIACYPGDGADAQEVIRAAETAMFRAKERGKNTYAFYDISMSAGARENLELANALRLALKKDELTLAFQPRVRLDTGHITGMEALLRWHSADRGVVSPAVFIPVAEETGLIEELGWYVVDAAVDAARRIGAERMRDRRIAINVSARQLAKANFVAELVKRVHAGGLMPHWFEIELTESMIMADPAYSRDVIGLLREAGFTVSIDDFGTGYSSLNYLKHLPVDNLKIDRSFVMGLPEDEGDAAIVQAIVRMGQFLGLHIIAEGIETEAQHHYLKEAGCHEAQGFLFARPMPLEELLEKLD